jgi:membrane protease YdiL (CAAX protease family)
MNTLKSFAMNQPLLFVFSLTIIGFVLLLFISGIVYTQLHKPYSDIVLSLTRLGISACLLFFLWRSEWLKNAGINSIGSWQVWLLAVMGLIYFASAALYAFYGKVAFDFSNLINLPDARAAFIRQLIAVIYEEILFRGVVLFVLFNAWGKNKQGAIGSVVLTAVLFALPHFVSVFMGTSQQATIYLIVEGCIIAIWWGALVIWGGSLWPAVLLHFVVNAVVEIQGLSVSMLTPDVIPYRQLFLFSIPLGVIGVGLLLLM